MAVINFSHIIGDILVHKKKKLFADEEQNIFSLLIGILKFLFKNWGLVGLMRFMKKIQIQ